MRAEGRQVEARGTRLPGPPAVRRHDAASRERASPGMPAEIGFLAAHGLPPGLLLRAAARAREIDVTADQALLGAGFPEDTFYRLLARHLGMPYVERPMRLILPPGDPERLRLPDIVALSPNAAGLRWIMAPQGAALRALIELCHAGAGRGSGAAILSPRCLRALVRRQTRPALLHLASHGLSSWDQDLSAHGGPNAGQQAAIAMLAAAILAGCLAAPGALVGALLAVLSATFLISVLLRLCASVSSRMPPPPDEARIADHDLPVYTILVPLLREARVVPQLVAALDALDYPRAKLDIKLLVEEGDTATIAAIERLNLPARFDTIVAPAGKPRTKPRALNIGLHGARGDLLVVYDAEDRPEPGQLRAAVALFRRRPSRTACLQARLAIDHAGESWLTRLFALEYAGLFDVVMPGLAALRLPVPLGGTSNHFRTDVLRRVGAWDGFNVTEDIDLGFRLARFGFAVEALASTTFEEAPVTLDRWFPQRTRWLKGWMVTLMVVTRRPGRLVRELGVLPSLLMAAALLGTILGCLLGPLLCAIAIVDGAWCFWGPPQPPLRALAGAASCFLLLAGAASAVWPIWLGLKRRGRLDLAPWLMTLPAYLCLVSLAAWRALHEAVVAPDHWHKTEHGLAKQRGRGRAGHEDAASRWR